MSLILGADYYPEHWPKERCPKDADLMSKAGFNTVRLAEFAWSKIEGLDAGILKELGRKPITPLFY